jgi:hypothetical protein
MLLPLSSQLVLLVMLITLTSPVPGRPQSPAPAPGEVLASWYLSLVALLKQLTLPATDNAGLDTGSDF